MLNKAKAFTGLFQPDEKVAESFRIKPSLITAP